jgi:hypothetical protein
MKQFWKGVVSVALAMALAYGWTWTGLLKDLHWIDDAGRVKILAVITVFFFFQQVWLVLPKPVDRESVDARRPIISNYLDKFLADYYRTLQSLHPGAALPVVRINVMLPTTMLLYPWQKCTVKTSVHFVFQTVSKPRTGTRNHANKASQ